MRERRFWKRRLGIRQRSCPKARRRCSFVNLYMFVESPLLFSRRFFIFIFEYTLATYFDTKIIDNLDLTHFI